MKNLRKLVPIINYLLICFVLYISGKAFPEYIYIKDVLTIIVVAAVLILFRTLYAMTLVIIPLIIKVPWLLFISIIIYMLTGNILCLFLIDKIMKGFTITGVVPLIATAVLLNFCMIKTNNSKKDKIRI